MATGVTLAPPEASRARPQPSFFRDFRFGRPVCESRDATRGRSMRLSRTLSLHIAGRFAKSTVGMFLLCVLLILLVDYIETVRQFLGEREFDPKLAALVSLMRAPSVGESVLPFAVLFGSMATLSMVNRRLEFTVARAAGVSAWQFLFPGLLVGLLIGLFSVSVYNPLAAQLRQLSVEIGGDAIPAAARDPTFSAGPVWLQQSGRDGDSILGATETADEGLRLIGVTAFLLDDLGGFRARIDARSAQLIGDEWVFANARLTTANAPPEPPKSYRLHTNLSASEVRDSLANPEAVPFWRLPQLIDIVRQAGLPANQLRLQLQTLLARPVMLLAMVLIAGVVSLRFSRTFNPGRMILAGATAGFVLYVMMAIARDLGAGGVVSPVVAAWLPAALAAIASVTFLLVEEDG